MVTVSSVTCGAMAWWAHTGTPALPVRWVGTDLIRPGPRYCRNRKTTVIRPADGLL